MTTWNEEHETDKYGEGEIENILMGESVVDVPATFCLRERRVRACTPWNRFSLEWHTFRHKDHATNQTDVVRWRVDGKTQLVQRHEMEPAGIRMEVKTANMLTT